MTELEQLKEENAMLRRKLSPLADPDHAAIIEGVLDKYDLSQHTASYRGEVCVVLTAQLVWDMYNDTEPTNHDLTVVGHSLKVLLWEQSFRMGKRIYVKTLREVYP